MNAFLRVGGRSHSLLLAARLGTLLSPLWLVRAIKMIAAGSIEIIDGNAVP